MLALALTFCLLSRQSQKKKCATLANHSICRFWPTWWSGAERLFCLAQIWNPLATNWPGAAAIQLEDQEFPKKCGHTPGRRVIPMEDMVRKIQVAVDSRTDPNFLIIARTDARTTLGLDEALRRSEAYARAGADILFVESPESEEEMRQIGKSFDVPLLANMVERGRTPVLSRADLESIGYKLAIFPVTALLASVHAMQSVYQEFQAQGSSNKGSTELYDFADLTKLMGFEAIWEFEKRYAETK